MLALKSHPQQLNNITSLSEWTKKKIGRVFPRKGHIFYQGDPATHFYKVNSGVVMIYRLLEDSQRQITGFCTKGDFFGLSPDELHHDSALAVSTSSVVSLTLNDIGSDPKLQNELFNRTCRQLEDAQNMMMTLTKKSAGEKVAAFLLMLAKRQEKIDSREDLGVFLPMSRLDIADYLGLTIETVSRRLTELKSQGIIELPDRRTALINNFGKLEKAAGALS